MDASFAACGWQRRHFRLGSLPLETLLLLPSHPPEVGGGILEFPVLDELADQVPARVFLLVFLRKNLQIYREQLLAFNVHQRGGHHDEIPGEVEVEPLHQLDVFAELVGQLDHIHLVDIDLFLANKMQQQVQRPLKNLKLISQLAHWPAGRVLSDGDDLVDDSQLPIGERRAGGQHAVRVEFVTVAFAIIAVRRDVERPHETVLQRPPGAVFQFALTAKHRRRGVRLGQAVVLVPVAKQAVASDQTAHHRVDCEGMLVRPKDAAHLGHRTGGSVEHDSRAGLAKHEAAAVHVAESRLAGEHGEVVPHEAVDQRRHRRERRVVANRWT